MPSVAVAKRRDNLHTAVKARGACLQHGFSLLELLIVVMLIAILAALVIPNGSTDIPTQLEEAGLIVASDLNYCQSLAVTFNSTYRVRFDNDGDRYYLEHTGSDASLDTLPRQAMHDATSPTQHTVRLSEQPRLGSDVLVAAVRAMGSSPSDVSEIEFGPLGETTLAVEHVVWLTAGSGDSQRYLPVSVDPVTGHCEIGDIQRSSPVSE